MKFLEEHFEKIKFISLVAAAMVIGVEFIQEMRKSKFKRYIDDDVNSFTIVAFLTILIYLWFEYGDDAIEYFVGKEHSTIVTILSLLIGYFIFKISGIFKILDEYYDKIF